MKHFAGAGTLVALALIVRLWALQRIFVDIHVHDTYRVFPLRVVVFWVLIGIALAWFLIAAYKLVGKRFGLRGRTTVVRTEY